MLFLMELYLIFFTIFLTSLLINLIVRSDLIIKEKDLQVSYGFILYTLWSTVFFEFVPIQYVFLMGVLFLSILLLNKYKAVFNDLQEGKKEYLKTFSIYFLLFNIFLLPMLLSGAVGSFSEGGGDITIYANTSYLLVSNNLPAGGYQIFANEFNTLFPFMHIPEQINFLSYNNDIGFNYYNYPYALADSASLVKIAKFSSGLYAPVSEWFFISNDYHAIFFALLGFLYSSIVFSFFKLMQHLTGNNKYAVLSSLLLVASHAFVSAFYNVYLLQVISMFIIMFMLRLYFLNATIIIILTASILGIFVYTPFLPIYLVLVALILVHDIKNIKFWRYDTQKTDFIKPIFVFFVLVIFLVHAGSYVLQTIKAILGSFVTNVNSSTSLYFGDAVSFNSFEFISFISGLLSQQHFAPFILETTTTKILVGINYFLFLLITAILVMNLKKYKMSEHKLLVLSSIFLILAYMFAGKATLYTQAKSIQYVQLFVYLVYLYLAYIVFKNTTHQKLKMFYQIVFILFITNMLIIRIIYAEKISNNSDRASVVSNSELLELITSVKKDNQEAIVLFEPRKSSDIYVVPHLFAYNDVKYIPTKDLSLYFREKTMNNIKRDIIASDFINDKNYMNVYNIVYDADKKSFKSFKFGDTSVTNAIYTSHYHEKNFKKEDIDGAEMNISYIRNGNVMIHFNANDLSKKYVKLYFKEPHDKTDEILKFLEGHQYKSLQNGWIEIEMAIDKINYLTTPKIWSEYYFAYKMKG